MEIVVYTALFSISALSGSWGSAVYYDCPKPQNTVTLIANTEKKMEE